MRVLSAMGGGLAGAIALTLLHEIVRRVDEDAPRMDLLGMDALSKGLAKTGQQVPDDEKLYALTFAGDILSNSIYYSLAALGNRKYVVPKGTVLGLSAGLGALFLPKQIGLNPKYSNKTLKTQLLTTGFYLIGGLVASMVSKAIEKKQEKIDNHHPQLWV